MSTRRKPRPSRAKSSPSKSSPSKSSPLRPSLVNSSSLKPSKASKKLPSIPSPEADEHSMEGFPSFNTEQSSTLLSPESDLAPDTSTTNGEQSSALQANASASADNQNGKRARTVSELPSLPLPSETPLSNAFIKQLRQLIPTGQLIPSLSHTQNLYTRHILHKGFVFSLFECSVICAIRMFVQNKDGSWADDDTATEVLRAMRNTTSTVDCQGLYEHMMLQGSSDIQDRDDWEAQVYNELQTRKSLWAEIAQAYWSGWIAYMNNICRCYKDAGRLEELTGVVPVVDVEPFRTVYESSQPLSFMPRMPVHRNRQRPNRMRMPNQWANQTAMLSPMQMQFPDQVPNQTMFPMSPQTQMQMHNTLGDQVRMPGPAPMQFQDQWPDQTRMPAMAEYPVRGASQMLTYKQLQNQHLQNQQLQNQRRLQMQMQMELPSQVYLPQMEQMQADTLLLIPSTTELQMPAPKRPVEASDIASIATQMLTPFPVQPPTLPTQALPLGNQRRRAKDDIIQED